jgi:hypothetical protein
MSKQLVNEIFRGTGSFLDQQDHADPFREILAVLVGDLDHTVFDRGLKFG